MTKKPQLTVDEIVLSESVSAPTLLDGTPIDKEEAAKMHAGLTSGEMKIELDDGVAEQLA